MDDAIEIQHENERRLLLWERSIPDSRLGSTKGQVMSPFGLLTPIFCINCGISCGAVYGDVTYTHALCDACGERWGGLPGVPGRVGTVDANGIVHF